MKSTPEQIAVCNILILIILLFCTSASYQKSGNTMASNDRFASIAEIKVRYPDANKWLEAEHGETKYLFSEIVLPSWGQSKIAIFGWVFREFKRGGRWEQFLNIETRGVYTGKMIVDVNEGVFSYCGDANSPLGKQELIRIGLFGVEEPKGGYRKKRP